MSDDTESTNYFWQHVQKLSLRWKIGLALVAIGVGCHISWSRVQHERRRSERRAAKKAKRQEKARARQAVVPVVQQTPDEAAKEAAKAARKLQKLQKQERTWNAKRADARNKITEVGNAFQQARTGTPVVCVSIDIEAWEQDTSKVTEVGLATVHFPREFESHREASTRIDDTSSGTFLEAECFHHQHILVSEHLGLRSGKYVDDKRDNFIFGNSQVMTLPQVAHMISVELQTADYIVGHAMTGDLEWLRFIGVTGLDDIPSLSHKLVDTQALEMAEELVWDEHSTSQKIPQRSLHELARTHKLNPVSLHNAANDAAFTIQVMLLQCGVAFQQPRRSESNHLECPLFQQAQMAAEASCKHELDERTRPFRDEVTAYAASCSADVAREEHQFPPTLTKEERGIVHHLALSLGLDTCSRGSGEERYISIFPKTSASTREDDKPRKKRNRKKERT